SAGRINLSLLDFAQREIDPLTGLPQLTMPWSPQLAATIGQLKAAMAPLVDFRRQVVELDLPRIEGDIDALAESQDRRRSQAQALRQTYRQNQGKICTLLDFGDVNEEIFSGEHVGGVLTDVRSDFEKLSTRFEVYVQAIDNLV